MILHVRAVFKLTCRFCSGTGLFGVDGGLCAQCGGFGKLFPNVTVKLRGCQIVQERFNPDARVHAAGSQAISPMCGQKLNNPKAAYGVFSQITCRRCLRNSWANQ